MALQLLTQDFDFSVLFCATFCALLAEEEKNFFRVPCPDEEKVTIHFSFKTVICSFLRAFFAYFLVQIALFLDESVQGNGFDGQVCLVTNN